MECSAASCKGQKAARDIIDAFREVGATLGHELYRVVLYQDGGGEVEFNSPIPWECLVLRWEDLSGLLNLLTQMGNKGKPEGHAAIRKKCTKCFMHEKRIELGDLAE
jgi:hypothetical protein